MSWRTESSPQFELPPFTVTLPSDGVFEVTTGGSPAGDTVVGVFDVNGTQLIGCDDDNPTPQDFYSAFSCCLPAGDYCIGVKGFNGNPISAYTTNFRSAGSCSANPDPTQNGCGIENTYGSCDPF